MFTAIAIFGLVLTVAQTSSAINCADISLPREDVVRGDLGSRADAFLREMTDAGFSGSVLISRDGNIILKKGYGYADIDGQRLNHTETLFNIASVSKIFTAAAILDLEEQRLLSPGDRLSEYLGAFPDQKAASTVHQLLVHTAGLVVRGAELNYDSRESFIESVKQAAIESLPGEKYRYTNAGYVLLAAIVEIVSGMPFEEYLSERLFDPACMTQTAFVWEEHVQNLDSAIGYAGDTLGELTPVPAETDIWGNRGPSNIATNVGDLYKWILALKSGHVLSKASMEKMFTAHVRDEGYGWHVIDSEHGRLLRRGGGLPDFESSLRWYQDLDLVIVVLINNHLSFRGPIVRGLEEVVFGQSANVP